MTHRITSHIMKYIACQTSSFIWLHAANMVGRSWVSTTSCSARTDSLPCSCSPPPLTPKSQIPCAGPPDSQADPEEGKTGKLHHHPRKGQRSRAHWPAKQNSVWMDHGRAGDIHQSTHFPAALCSNLTLRRNA